MKRVILAWLGLLAPTLVLTAPAGADACVRRSSLVVQRQQEKRVDPQLRNVTLAERLLAKGNARRAATYARRAFPDVDQLLVGEDVSPLRDRAQRVAAMAAIQTGGAVALGPKFRGQSAYEQAVNRMWAALVMQYQHARHRDNVVVEVQYAQAVAQVEGLESHAFAMLERLAVDDLMPTASGYVTLARLQTHRGDERGRDTSLARCREIAGATACNLA